jgi:transcriptional regulator with XRE-family HTH domain
MLILLGTPPVMDFPTKLRIRLKQMGLTQGTFAELVGTSQSNVSDWMRKKSVPTLPLAQRAAKALGVTMDYLFDEEIEEMPRPALTPEEQVLLDVTRKLGPNGAQEVLSRLITGQVSPGWVPLGPTHGGPPKGDRGPEAPRDP